MQKITPQVLAKFVAGHNLVLVNPFSKQHPFGFWNAFKVTHKQAVVHKCRVLSVASPELSDASMAINWSHSCQFCSQCDVVVVERNS